MNQAKEKRGKFTVAKVLQYICIGLLAFINYFLVSLVLIPFLGDSVVVQNVVPAVVVGCVIALAFTPAIDSFFVLLKRLKPFERIEEHEKRQYSDIDEKYHSFLAMLQETCNEQNINMPKVYIAHSDFPHAFFVTDRVFAVTLNFINGLTLDEQKAAVLHEMYHVKNRDVQLLSVADAANVFGGIVTWILTAVLSFLGLSGSINAISASASGDTDSAHTGIALLIVAWMFRGLLALINWFVHVLTLGISRSGDYSADEFVADAGYKDALVSYLQKMSSLDPKQFEGYAVEMWKRQVAPKARINHIMAYSPKALLA